MSAAAARYCAAGSASGPLVSLARAAYVMAMADAPDNAPNSKLRIAGAVVLFGVLFAMLIAAGWHAVGAWNSMGGAPMPTTGYVAMTLGIVFSLVVGCGLMALLFYSNRHGYDDRIHYDALHEDDDPRQSEDDQQQ